jgi:hypothetical protein
MVSGGTRAASRRVCIRTVIVALAFVASVAVAGEEVGEYHVKAAYLFNFTRFIDWPPAAFATPDASFAVCVLGPDPFGTALADVFAGETVGGREVVVRRIGEPAEARGCHIVFTADLALAGAIAAALEKRPVLTVGDGEAFARGGGMIAFRPEGPTIRFDVNAAVLEAAGLTASSQLLGLARIVGDHR